MVIYDGTTHRFVTCSGEGERVYARNGYMVITGINTAVQGSSGSLPPTFMTQVTIK